MADITDQIPERIPINLVVNGARRTLEVVPWTTLLDALRDRLELTGTKKGCDHGQCGACTVLVDGRRVNSCLTLAVMKDGAEITTIEGLAKDGALHPLQQAFIDSPARRRSRREADCRRHQPDRPDERERRTALPADRHLPPANAVYHATGKRIRRFPITLDKLMD
jgi:Aerobic-type carbon monoxide dehydrogenase, small subunit CoxS/CutS homologs